METPNPKFRVLIVGGSVTGLTLAHCLAKNGIEFTLLEAGKEIAPQVGASIGLFPNGGRILDQLGIFDDIMQQVEPLKKASLWSDDKKLILQSDSPQVLHERHGYPIAFLERRCLLEILYKHLGHQQDEVLTNKRVINIEHYSTHVVAHCADDTSYEGDIVVGADGIRSTVRKSMWTYMENHGLQSQVQKERAIMSAEYSCVFGISKFTPGLKPGESHRTFAEGYSFLTIVGKDKVYWFFFRCMNCKFYGDEIPRLDQNNIDEHVGPYLEKPITDSVPFGEVYNRAITRTHLALEEAEYQHYCIDRWVCIGDSIHKMTPNLGQGGNSAIESAAALANSIAKLIQSTSQFQTEDIHRSFKGWEATRQQRVVGIWKSAHDLTRLEAIQSLKDRLKIYLIPYMNTQMIDRSSKAIIGAERLDCVALPPRSLQCSMPYKSDNKTCQPTFDSLWTRALLCAQFVGCIAVARGTMRPTIAQVRPLLVPYLKQGTWTARNGEVVDLTLSIYHVPFLDNLFRPLIACFLPSISGSDMQSRTQMLCFITDLGSVYGMWLLESYRKGGSWPGVLLAIGMGTAFQLKGVGYFAPVFYMLDYLRLPLEHLLHDNKSEIAPATSISLLLATLVGHHLPNFACFLVPSLKDRRWWNAVWQLFPVTIPLIQVFMLYPRRLHAKAEREAAKEKKDKTSMQSIRFTYGSFALISALTFIYARHSAPAEASLASIFWPGVSGHLLPVTSFEGGIARFLRYDHIISTGSGFVWLVLRFRELKNLGANISWWKAIGAFIGTTWALGPGTAFALGWGWKEELLNEFTTPNK